MEELKDRIKFVISATPNKGVHNKALIAAYEHVLKMIPEENTTTETVKSLLDGMIKNGLGSSAKTVICHMLDLKEKSQYTSIPYDSGDFSRCQNVLDSIPNWREELPKLSKISIRWAQLVLNWEEILIHCKEGDQKAANELIDRCIELTH